MLLPFLQYHNRFPRSHNTFISVSLLPLPLFSSHPVPRWSVLVFCSCLFECLFVWTFGIAFAFIIDSWFSFLMFGSCFSISFRILNLTFNIGVLVLERFFSFFLAFSLPPFSQFIPFFHPISAHTNLNRDPWILKLLSSSHPVFPLFFLSPPSFLPLPLSVNAHFSRACPVDNLSQDSLIQCGWHANYINPRPRVCLSTAANIGESGRLL